MTFSTGCVHLTGKAYHLLDGVEGNGRPAYRLQKLSYRVPVSGVPDTVANRKTYSKVHHMKWTDIKEDLINLHNGSPRK